MEGSQEPGSGLGEEGTSVSRRWKAGDSGGRHGAPDSTVGCVVCPLTGTPHRWLQLQTPRKGRVWVPLAAAGGRLPQAAERPLGAGPALGSGHVQMSPRRPGLQGASSQIMPGTAPTPRPARGPAEGSDWFWRMGPLSVTGVPQHSPIPFLLSYYDLSLFLRGRTLPQTRPRSSLRFHAPCRETEVLSCA